MRHHNVGIFAWFLYASGMAAAQVAPLPISYTQVQSSGMVGITGSQTARLNVLNLSTTSPAGVTASCSAQITFLDDQGTVLKTATVTPGPGKSMLVDYPSTASVRQQIRVTIGVAYPNVTAPAAGSGIAMPIYFCSLLPTLEVFNNSTLQTTLVVSDFHSVYAYPMPLIGVATGTPPVR